MSSLYNYRYRLIVSSVYPSLLELLVTLDGPSGHIENMYLLLSFVKTLLVYDTADDLQLRPHDENDLVARWLNGFSRLQGQHIDNTRWLPSHYKCQLLQQVFIEVYRFVPLHLNIQVSLNNKINEYRFKVLKESPLVVVLQKRKVNLVLGPSTLLAFHDYIYYISFF